MSCPEDVLSSCFSIFKMLVGLFNTLSSPWKKTTLCNIICTSEHFMEWGSYMD